jgi:hydrogenase nickel incorporation protein HypA/HybF
MHELGIAEAVLDAVRSEAARHGDVRVHKVGVKIGELAGLDCEAFRFCFEAIARDTEFESLILEIEHCPRRQRCSNCQQEFVVKDHDLHCPSCGRVYGECIGGNELDLSYLEVGEHATSGVGAESIE